METKHPTNSRNITDRKSPREKMLWQMFKLTLATAAWAAAILSLISLYQDSTNRIGFDFYQFWLGGDVVRARTIHGDGHPVDLYSDAAFQNIATQYQALAATHSRRQREAAAVWHVLYTASTPFFYWVFSIATPGDYDRMFIAFRNISMGCLILNISAVGWRLRYPIAAIGAAIALAAVSAPVQSDFFVTNINCPQLTACLVYLFLRDWARRLPALSWILQTAAGVLIGMLIAFKPNLVLLPLLLGFAGLVYGHWRQAITEAAGMALGLAGAVGVSSWRFGSIACWWNWWRVIRQLGSQLSMPSRYGNISLSRMLLELTGHNFFAALVIVLVTLSLAAIWLGRPSVTPQAPPDFRDFEFRHDLTLFGIAATITFMASGLAWLHYPILIFPFLMLVASRRIAGPTTIRFSDGVRYVFAVAVIVLLMLPPAKAMESLLSWRVEMTPGSWIRCTQAAIIISFGIGLWIESHARRPENRLAQRLQFGVVCRIITLWESNATHSDRARRCSHD